MIRNLIRLKLKIYQDSLIQAKKEQITLSLLMIYKVKIYLSMEIRNIIKTRLD